jgi:alpha-galactosidase
MSITVLENRVFCLCTRNTSYVIFVDDDGMPQCVHWGGLTANSADYLPYKFPELRKRGDSGREECSSFGTLHFKETSLKLRFEDGVRDFRYNIESWRLDGGHLVIILKDREYPFLVKLHYRVYEEWDVIEKWREAVYTGTGQMVLERFHSAEFSLPGTGYESINFNGDWGREFSAGSSKITAGKVIYESLFGITGHRTGPFFMLHRDADEEKGEVYFGALAYSGNHKIVVEAAPHYYTSILVGISDTDCEIPLAGNMLFETPHAYALYTSGGFGALSNNLAAFAREHIMSETWRHRPLPVLYNSWYATAFNIQSDEQISLAEKAAQMGIELFVVDDGWFKNRVSSCSGLGDWTADEKKFPFGLGPLVRRVNELGMSFGIWIEPEMVNPDSDLYRAHPDWILRYGSREVITRRNQYYLDCSNPLVIRYLKDCFDKLFAEYNLAYIKWDMNRYVAEMGSLTRSPEEFKGMWHLNTQGVYELRSYLLKKYPHVEFESCASGGGRVDYCTMACFDEFWPSDNTDPLDRLFIQEHYSLIYPIKHMRAWFTDVFGMDNRNIPLRFGMYCAMCGSLGIGVDLNKKSEEERAEIAGYITQYKKIRETIQFGDLYRLKSLTRDEIHAVQYVHKEQAVLFVFLDHERYGKKDYPLRLRGLEPGVIYRFEQDGRPVEKSGAFLMQKGLLLTLKGDYASDMILFARGDTV